MEVAHDEERAQGVQVDPRGVRAGELLPANT
jgi:hypothetical protein